MAGKRAKNAKNAKSKILHDLYYNVNRTTAFGGFSKLFEAARKKNPHITRLYAKQWYLNQKTATVWYNTKKAKRNPTVQVRPFHQFQVDLADFGYFAKWNQNFRYILVAICVFTRYAYCEAIKTKSAKEVGDAIEKIFDKISSAKIFQSDLGSEFYNSRVKKYLKNRKIELWLSEDRLVKASLAERFIRTLRSKILKYLTANNGKKWFHVYKRIVENYNNTVHRSHGFAPAKIDVLNANVARRKLYPRVVDKKAKKSGQNLLKIGDKVKISRIKNTFEKNTYNYTHEIFKIFKIINRTPHPVYKLRDLKNEDIKGIFYAQELLKINV